MSVKPRDGKSMRMHIRLLPHEYQQISSLARNDGLSVSAYIRKKALSRKMKKLRYAEIMMALEKLREQQINLYMADQRNEHQYQLLMKIMLDVINETARLATTFASVNTTNTTDDVISSQVSEIYGRIYVLLQSHRFIR